MHTIVTDTAPAFIESGLLPVMRNILNDKQSDDTNKELLLKSLHVITSSPFGVKSVLQDAVLCKAVVNTALTEASSWCALREEETANRTMGTDLITEEMIHATNRVAQALFTLANLFEAGRLYADT
jgi:hypothetical protein